jgi:hypothetical protein
LNLQQETFFPTLRQRSTLDDTDSELLGILNRAADSDRFVVSDVPAWAMALHGWPEVAGDQQKREEFVRERIAAFVRLGVLSGSHRRGFVIPGHRGERPFQWSAKDAKFLRVCGISPTDDTREQVERSDRIVHRCA